MIRWRLLLIALLVWPVTLEGQPQPYRPGIFSEVYIGGAGAPALLSGSTDPTSGSGVTLATGADAPNGSVYLETTTGTVYVKTGPGATAWTEVGTGSGGVPAGSAGDLQINDGMGGFGAYAGDSCSPGDFVTGIGSDGTVTCATPPTAVCAAGENPLPVTLTAGAATVDFASYAQHVVELDDDLDTLTLSNGVDGCTYRILFVQDNSGGHTVTWPADVKFEDDTAPTFDTSADNVTFCSLVKTAVGSGGYLGFCTENPITQP